MGNSFSDSDFSIQRNILNFKPNIHYVEPDSIDEGPLPISENIPTTIEDQIQDAENLIKSYSDIEAACDELQELINNRSVNVVIQLDSVQDAHIISAVQRHLGDPNKTTITFQDYLKCINDQNALGEDNISVIDPNDVASAASDPFRDKFGSIDFQSGMSRPELQSPNQSIQPVDLDQFKSNQLQQLFDLFKPQIIKLIKDTSTGGIL